jgi:AraC family transcriptional regulator of adaptative response / DNA-3-methyladenine glycosylase II
LGQQISVTAAKNLVTKVVENLGEEMPESEQSGIQQVGVSGQVKRLFPKPAAFVENEFAFLKMPGSRKQTLRNLAQHYVSKDNPDDPEAWLRLKGIGPWTTEYAQMRGLSDPDIYLAGDLGVKKAMFKALNDAENSDDAKQLTTKPDDLEMKKFNPETASPWRSYLTFQLWSQL